ncbi:unnamed protein product [Hapterophycus canaliculatus]
MPPFLTVHRGSKGFMRQHCDPMPCRALLPQGTAVLDAEENVLELGGETVVVGDLHGQFFDLVNLLGTYGRVSAG